LARSTKSHDDYDESAMDIDSEDEQEHIVAPFMPQKEPTT